MADVEAEGKTQKPTPKRRGEARQKGNVCKSTEVSTVFVLLAALIILRLTFKYFYSRVVGGVDLAFRYLAPDTFRVITLETFIEIFKQQLFISLWIVLPISAFIMFWGVASNVIQIGWLFTWQPIQPKLSKINPISGFKKFLSLRPFIDTFKNILKLVIIGSVAYNVIVSRVDEMLGAINESVGSIAAYMLLLIYDVSIRIVIALLIIAVIDYAYQKYEYEKNLKMSKQEIKDEHKMMDGDPKVKGKIRKMQGEISRRRMMENVPKATVVVTNPTHLSIAIQYEQDTMDAPLVVAKGADLIALKIREIAKEHNIPLYEDVPLARALYDKVEPGDTIPQEFFAAVAEVIAYVYKLKGR